MIFGTVHDLSHDTCTYFRRTYPNDRIFNPSLNAIIFNTEAYDMGNHCVPNILQLLFRSPVLFNGYIYVKSRKSKMSANVEYFCMINIYRRHYKMNLFRPRYS